MPVLVTRPAQEARDWVERLQAHGLAAEAMPLIAIEAAPDSRALREAWAGLAQCRAAMFVSGNAVRGFFARRPAGTAFAVRAWATGPGTAQALREAGVPEDCIDQPPAASTQFDSEALWREVAPQLAPGERVLIVRGGDAQGRVAGRDWMATQLAQAGVEVREVVAYVRRGPRWSQAELARARAAAQDGSVWLFSSSEALAHLASLMPGQHWGSAKAVATHPRVAEAARTAGFGTVHEARPALGDVIACLQSLR